MRTMRSARRQTRLGPEPSISIVLPNYNHSAYLPSSLSAIVTQTRPADEIIIVDDGSTDNSLDIIASFAARTPAMRVVRHVERQGVVAAVNRGIREATGDYIILASADERIMETMCERMAKARDAFPDAKLFVAHFTEWWPETGKLRCGEDGETALWFVEGPAPCRLSPEDLIAQLRRRHVRLSANAAMFERATLLKCGLLDGALKWHSDWFMIYAVAFRHGFVAIPEVLSWFRVTEESYSVRGVAATAEQERVVLNLHGKLSQPEYADIRRALMRGPSAMDPFMRQTLTVLPRHPRYWNRLVYIGAWWLREVALGRRPRRWARMLQRMGQAAGRPSGETLDAEAPSSGRRPRR
jgi:glycosyltransferase involved in cell wall biosynthesis